MEKFINIREAKTKEDISKCWEVMLALRPHLRQEDFVDTVLKMFQQGYKLAFIEKDGKAVAAVGYRFQYFLYSGKHIYIDDLSTLPAYRAQGLGGELLDYVSHLAKVNGLKTISLDSGYQRTDAHRLYLNKGYVMTSHHFEKKISVNDR